MVPNVSFRVAGPVEEARSLSVQDFYRDYHNARACKPVVFPGLMTEAAELGSSWTDEHLKATIGHVEIPIYVSADGTFPGGKGPWDPAKYRFVKMRFSECLERMHREGGHSPIIAPGEKYYVWHTGVQNVAALFAGLAVKDPMYIPAERRDTGAVTRRFWFSEEGCITSTHQDFSDGFLAQVRGRKRVLVWSPAQSELLYINPLGSLHDRISAVDIKNPDLRVHPRYEEARALECFLSPGDVLFIPSGWNHCVISLEFSISVNYAWRMAQFGGFMNTTEKILLSQYLLPLYPLRPELRALMTYHLQKRVARRVRRALSWAGRR